ncbi:MAG: DUF5916 domain-containing protein [Saprospiraceae bacterium]|nr:DUF5916 domain-containing protein [Saprospiraceae bacterium]
MKYRTLTLLFLFLSNSIFLSAQLSVRTMTAVRIDGQLTIDGILNEKEWSQSDVATGFTQTEPVYNVPPSQKTEVRILYNDKGIYVGATMYDTDPDNILKELSPRDQRGNTDWFGVVFDTYQDGLNGFDFIVTASGVQNDKKFSINEEGGNWDGIWESEVKITEEGWIAELFIPYLSLRFPTKDIQEWNINFGREIRRYREQVYWNPINPAIEGFLNQAGKLKGITNIKSPVRLSLTPFVTGYLNTISNGNNGQGAEVSTAYTGGMDLKYGINDAFTLDMTLIPDFGQVLSDNQVLNLSPFEVFFQENRQFFTEGVELFDRSTLFYTRRVGGRPLNYFDAYSQLQSGEEVISNPDIVQLYNATKISGRTSSGTGIGIFNAVAGKEFATIRNTNTDEVRQVETNPLTNYNVLVADQNLANNSVISLMNTNVTRFGDEYDANSTGIFLDLRNKEQIYGLSGRFISSNQFFNNNTNSGQEYALSLAKIGGNWRGFLNYFARTDNFNTNDLGFLQQPNIQNFNGNISYNEFNPKNQSQQRWEVGISPSYTRLYNPNVFSDFAINFNSFMLWKSRNAIGLNGRIEPIETYDYFEPRTLDFSKFYTFPTNWRIGGFFSSDYRKTLALDINSSFRSFNEPGRKFLQVSFSPRVRVNDKLSFFLNTSYSKSNNETGFVNYALSSQIIPGLASGDVMIGTRDRKIIQNSIRGQFIFNNKMSLSLRIRHYWDQVEYSKYGRLQDDGYLANLDFEGIENGESLYDQNVNFFNIDMNYIWRFAKGSDIIFNWKQSISSSDRDLDSAYFNNLSGIFNAQQLNSVSLKIVYFLDYDSIVKR